jgi:RNA-binding protein YhbY
MEPTLFIGKSKIEKVVKEAKKQLDARDEIKVKVNQPLIEGRMSEFTKKVADELSQKTDSKVLWVKGRTFVLRGSRK